MASFKNALFFVFIISLSPVCRAESWTEQTAGTISKEACHKIFPLGQWLELPEAYGEAHFQFFYFTTRPFEPNKPSVLVIAGGPGQILSPAESRDDYFPDYNVVYFHPRGGGCSPLPPDNYQDNYIATRFTIDDLEALREKLGIRQWAAAYAISYGTVVANYYANQKPEAIKTLILHGLAVPRAPWLDRKLTFDKFTRILQIRRNDKNSFVEHLSQSDYENFEKRFLAFFKYLSPDGYVDLDLPKSNSAEIFLAARAIESLIYSGAGEAADPPLRILLKNLAGIDPESALWSQANQDVNRRHEILNPENSSLGGLLLAGSYKSPRVWEATHNNDRFFGAAMNYNSIPTLVFQGGLDAATPVEYAQEFLSHKTGPAGRVVLAISPEAGHGFEYGPCTKQLITEFVRSSGYRQDSCPTGTTLVKY